MDEHRLAGVCAYIEDFRNWKYKEKLPEDIRNFINDRFSECSIEKKEKLFVIFSRLSEKISNSPKMISDTASKLLEVLW